MNAYTERFIGSVRRECFACVIPLGERHLRQILHDYLDHYHTERNHQGLDNNLVTAPALHNAADSGRVLCRRRLGGVLNFYYRDAA